jgi:uncharacterized membrane protein
LFSNEIVISSLGDIIVLGKETCAVIDFREVNVLVWYFPPVIDKHFRLGYLSLPNNVWRLIVFAPILIIIIIIILFLSFFLSVDHELVHGRSQELLDRIS